MPPGVLFAFGAYALYSCSDAIIKGLGGSLSIYEIAFYTTLFSLLPAILTTPRGENWLLVWKLRHPLLVNLRGISGMVGNLCIIYAFVSIPLAEAYSLAFLAPIFIVVISVHLLGEKVSRQRWLLLAVSFIGVLVVVRPGFRELHWGHITAIGAALCGAVTTTTMRRVACDEMRISLIGVASAYILVLNGILALTHGGFHLPDAAQLGFLLAVGALGGTGNLLFIAATRHAPASMVAPVQYSQIFWAILFGSVFYREFPAPIAYAGLVLVVSAGVLNVISDETRIRFFSRLSPGGAGPSTMRESTRVPEADDVPEAADAVLEAPIAGAVEVVTRTGT